MDFSFEKKYFQNKKKTVDSFEVFAADAGARGRRRGGATGRRRRCATFARRAAFRDAPDTRRAVATATARRNGVDTVVLPIFHRFNRFFFHFRRSILLCSDLIETAIFFFK